jgi:hypothetical protein
MPQVLGTTKLISGFDPRSVGSCQLWLDAADTGTMNSTSTVTQWNDKSGNGSNVVGTATYSGGTMTFNGTQAFSNTGFVFPNSAYSMFAVYSNTTAPAAAAYMNVVYGNGGYPMLGTFDTTKAVTARSVVGNVGGLGQTVTVNPNGWATQIAGTTTSDDRGFGVATDSSGNVFVTGNYSAACTLYNTGGGVGATLAFTSGNDAFLAKYSSAGSVLWAAQIASTSTDIGLGVATDSSGNVFVTGYYNAAVTLYNFGGGTGATLTTAGVSDCFLAKYSSAGSVLWATRIAALGTDQGYAVATDSSGNVFVTGYYGNTLTLYNTGGGTGATLTGGSDAFLAKYSSAGSVVWATRISGTGGLDYGFGVATDSSGNVFVTGYYTGPCTLYNTGGGTGATLSAGASTLVGFLAKYSSAGSVVWAAAISVGNGGGFSVAINSSGDVLVTGQYGGQDCTLQNTGGTTGATLTLAGGAGFDAFLAKYSSAGSVVWATRIATSAGNEGGNGVATDSSGNVFVTGYYGAALTLYNTGGTTGATLAYTGGNDCFLAKYSSDGVIITGTTTTIIGSGYPASSNILVDGTYAPSSFSPYVKGSNVTALAGTTAAATGLFIGGPSNYFNGSLSELLIYASTLSTTQRQAVEGYLTWKWNLRSSFLVSHPLYTTPPFMKAFTPLDITGCRLWMDAADTSTMNSTTTVTSWSDKSGNANTMTGTATLSGGKMTFNGTNQAFSNTGFVFPNSAYSMFAVYSNTTAPASTAYMNVVYGNGGYPMLGTFDTGKYVTARSVVENTGPVNTGAGWAARIASATGDIGNAVATDSSGNVFVTGYYNAAVTLYNFGGGTGATLAFNGGTDCFLAKYSSAGSVLWAVQIASTGTDRGSAVATDSSGNVFVTGHYGGALTLYNTGGGVGATLAFTGGNDAFLAKYSSAGSVLWAAQITGSTPSDDRGYGVATDSNGNVFVTGQYQATCTLYNAIGGTFVTLAYTGGNDAFLARYSTAGSLLWATRIAGTTTSSDVPNSVATDSSGNVFVTGYYQAALTLYNAPGATGGGSLAFTGGNDAFLAKYSSAGSVLWATRITGTTTSDDQGKSVATDSSGNVFVTGHYSAACTLYNTGGGVGATLTAGGNLDCFLAKYSSAGSVVWAARIVAGDLGSTDTGQAVATDSNGNVFVTGRYSSATLTLYNSSGGAGATLPFSSSEDCFLAKYSSTGTVLWAAQISGPGSLDNGYGVATDSNGNVFVTGLSDAALTLYNAGGGISVNMPNQGSYDVFLAKYTSDGFIIQSVPASSNVLVSGTYTSSTFSPFVNGSNVTALTGTTAAATGIFIGGPTNYFNGSLSELLIYAATLTTAQRQQLEGYLAKKWGLTSSLISTQPYKTYSLPFTTTVSSNFTIS